MSFRWFSLTLMLGSSTPGGVLISLGSMLLLSTTPSVSLALTVSVCVVADHSAVVSDVPCPPENTAPNLERHRIMMTIMCASPDLMRWLKTQQHPDHQARNAKLRELMESCRGEYDPPAATANTDGNGQPYTPAVPPFTQPVGFADDPMALRTRQPLAPPLPASATVSELPAKVVRYGAQRGLVNMDRSTTFEEPKRPAILDLGRLSGGGGGYASAISADGNLVVGEASHGNYGLVAFTWTPSTGMVSLDQSLLIRRSADAAAVNRDGSVIVGSWDSERTGLKRAFRWTRKTGIVTLGILPGADRSNARAVSADGRVVVGCSERAFRWTERTGMVALPGGRTIFGATAMSADGRMVFGEEYGPDGSHVIRWDEDGTITRYAKPLGAVGASVQAVSPDGSIAVGNYSFVFGRTAKNVQMQAAVWYSPTHLVSLGFLHGGKFSKATAVNADGSVVVGVATDGAAENQSTAFRWTAVTGMQSVEEWVRDAGGNPSVTPLDEAKGVSGDGLRVVGSLKSGTPFVAIVPRP